MSEAGKLAQDKLYTHLALHGYHLVDNHPGLLKHETRPIMFTLVVDDFGIKYKRHEDVQHLISTLQLLYKITIDWTGSKYLGYTIEHDKKAGTMSLSMPDYIPRLLQRMNIPLDGTPTYSPAPYTFIPHEKHNTTPIHAESVVLDKSQTKYIQRVVGSIQFYARSIDPTMLCDVNRLSSQQSKPTTTTESNTQHLLAYAATYPVVKLVYRKSDMILRIISDASHLGEPMSRSRVAGYFDLINTSDEPILAPPNGAVHITSSILNCVVASAAEAEFGGLFTNAQLGVDLRNKLIAMGHPQPPTPVITDKKCALGIATSTTKPMKSKSMDMRFIG